MIFMDDEENDREKYLFMKFFTIKVDQKFNDGDLNLCKDIFYCNITLSYFSFSILLQSSFINTMINLGLVVFDKCALIILSGCLTQTILICAIITLTRKKKREEKGAKN